MSLPDEVTIRKDDDDWLRLCELGGGSSGEGIDKWVFRANRWGKPKVKNDTGADKTQQVDAEGFVRARPKRKWDLTKIDQ